MRPRNRIPFRERFSQNLEGKEHTDHTTINLTDPERAPIYEDISSGSPNIIGILTLLFYFYHLFIIFKHNL